METCEKDPHVCSFVNFSIFGGFQDQTGLSSDLHPHLWRHSTNQMVFVWCLNSSCVSFIDSSSLVLHQTSSGGAINFNINPSLSWSSSDSESVKQKNDLSFPFCSLGNPILTWQTPIHNILVPFLCSEDIQTWDDQIFRSHKIAYLSSMRIFTISIYVTWLLSFLEATICYVFPFSKRSSILLKCTAINPSFRSNFWTLKSPSK